MHGEFNKHNYYDDDEWIEIDASLTLLQALDKTLPGDAAFSIDERFEIAALKFTVARALCLNKRARAS